MRAFLAIQLPDEVKAALGDVQGLVGRTAPGFYRWADAAQIHLTLYFLGEMEEEGLAPMTEALDVLEARRLSLSLSGIVLLPDARNPRVVAASVTGDVEALTRLQQRVADTVFPFAAFKETRRYYPHVTIGRLKRGKPGYAKALKRALSEAALPKTASFEVDRFELVRSHLGSAGSRYETLRAFALS